MRTVDKSRGKILLQTVHGSRLYGTHHADSDYDYYCVTEYGPSKQRIDGKDDSIVIGLKAFLTEIRKGSHQAMEALFSQISYTDPAYTDYFRNFSAYSVTAEDTYIRVITYLVNSEDPKRRKQAIRVMYNLEDLRELGRFNPTLSKIRLHRIKTMEEFLDQEDLRKALEKRLGKSLEYDTLKETKG